MSQWKFPAQGQCDDATILPTICVTAPARTAMKAVGSDEIDHARLDLAYENLYRLGWAIKEADNVRSLDKGFAGSDEARIQGLLDAFSDPDVDLVMAVRGGYGTTRLLDALPWEQIAQSSAVFMGLSDLTAFNLALMRQCRRASWQGPVLTYFARNPVMCADAFSLAMASSTFDQTFKIQGDAFQAAGPWWGGNLAMLVSFLGTPYFPSPDQIEGGILFIEDINEPAWRIERMLNQLILAGVLQRQQALVVCDTTGHDRWLAAGSAAFTLDDAFDYIRRQSGVKLVSGIRFGHVPDTATLPVGVHARVESDGNELRVVARDCPIPTQHPGALTSNSAQWWV